ncbi:unnamed protein product [Rhizophagus irregularis]|nr:unnamed protein product [Rhizophagus irregularis]
MDLGMCCLIGQRIPRVLAVWHSLVVPENTSSHSFLFRWRCKKFQSSLVDVSGDGEKEKGEDDNSNKGVEHQDVTRITKD